MCWIVRRLPITGWAIGWLPYERRSNSLSAVDSTSSSSSVSSCRITCRSRSSSASGKLLLRTMSPSIATKLGASPARPRMWYAVWSLSVCALTSAPRRSASRLICWQLRVCVPLNAMCSTKWLMPFRRRPSWLLPVRTKTLTLTLCRCGSRIDTTRTPLPRRTMVASGSLAGARVVVAICIAAIIAARSASIVALAVHALDQAGVDGERRIDLTLAESQPGAGDNALADRVGNDLEGVVREPASLDGEQLAGAEVGAAPQPIEADGTLEPPRRRATGRVEELD